MSNPLFIAVDLGAGSGRVFLAAAGPGELLLEEIHRFRYPPRDADGRLRWNFSLIFDEIKRGLRAAAERAGELGRRIHSIGVDSWAVDYGLLDSEGRLIADPVCYRDARMNGVMDDVFGQVSRAEIFERTGIQFLQFNTLFQFIADRGQFENATRMLLLPDLVNYSLTGRMYAEFTNATTTQMVNASSGRWDIDLLNRLKLPIDLLPEIIPAGSDIGFLQADMAEELGMDGVRVIAPATHDTGSAVAAAPLGERSAYISSGTWSLIGVERDTPLINQDAARLNFTNEGGVHGSIRFLKNVMGLWIFESCRREWGDAGIDADYEKLLAGVDELTEFEALIFPDDERFLNPTSMCGAIAEHLRETGQPPITDPVRLSKVIFDSLAFRYASVLKGIEGLTGTVLDDIYVLGGGGRNRYLNQMTANASGLRVQAGLTEATVLGNVLVQAVTAGRFATLADARQHVRENVSFEQFVPNRSAALNGAEMQYAEIEARFIK